MDLGWVIPIIVKMIGYAIIGAVGIILFALLMTELFLVFGAVRIEAKEGKRDGNEHRQIESEKDKE